MIGLRTLPGPRSGVHLAALAALSSAALALAACGSSGHTALPPPGSVTIKVVELGPPREVTVDAGSFIRARVAYELPAGYPGSYFVSPQVATTRAGELMPLELVSLAPVPKQGVKGSVKVEFGLLRALSEPTVRRPLEIWFCLSRRSDNGKQPSEIVAKLGPYRYNVR